MLCGLITLEPHCIFLSKFAYLRVYILEFLRHWYAKRCKYAKFYPNMPCGSRVKVVITLESHGIFGSNGTLIYFNISQTLVCQTVTRLLGESKTSKYAENYKI